MTQYQKIEAMLAKIQGVSEDVKDEAETEVSARRKKLLEEALKNLEEAYERIELLFF